MSSANENNSLNKNLYSRLSNIDSTGRERQRHLKSYDGFYVGIVIQNNDPDLSGKVKVWVPHVSPSVYENLYDANKDKTFTDLGKNIESDLSGIYNELKKVLPWAKYAGPILGSTSTGRFNAKKEISSISDSNKPELLDPITDFITTKYSLNKDGIGEKPARKYEVNELRVSDAYADARGEIPGTIKTGMPENVNPNARNYKPSSYSNCAKGTFSIPNVGAHVWVWFEDGDPLYPVYFAASYSQQDWKGIYEIDEDELSGMDYPGDFENRGDLENASYNHNVETYRNKMVINQKGGTFEIISTDNREALKMTHYSGSFKYFQNYVTTEFAAHDHNTIVNDDYFMTIGGSRNETTRGLYDLIVRGDYKRKIGNFNKEYFDKWDEISKDVHRVKQLFELKRVAFDGDTLRNKQSWAQEKNPAGKAGHGKCPLCSLETRPKFNITFARLDKYVPVNQGAVFNELAMDKWLVVKDSAGPIGGDGINDSSVLFQDNFPSVKFKTINSWSEGAFQQQPLISADDFLGGGPCPVCGGDGLSPSTAGGQFTVEDKILFDEKLKNNIESILQIERELGVGGSEIVNITKHLDITVGLVSNILPSRRIDPIGKITKNEIAPFPDGVITTFKESPLVEPVHVQDYPGGNYVVDAKNKFNVIAGSGGVSFKTGGHVEISGAITNIAGDQINISSENDINISSKNRVSISAEILNLRQNRYRQVFIESNLGVSHNVVIGGMMHVEGELCVQHVTAPTEFQETEEVALQGAVVTEEGYSVTISGGTHIDKADSADNHDSWTGATLTFHTHPRVQLNPHSHQFRNLPLTLTKTSNDVREVGTKALSAIPMPAAPVAHKKKEEVTFAKKDKYHGEG